MIAGRRAFVIVLDACGAGELPDAAEYGDAGTHTLRHVAEAEGGLDLPTLARLGLGNVTELPGVAPVRRCSSPNSSSARSPSRGALHRTSWPVAAVNRSTTSGGKPSG